MTIGPATMRSTTSVLLLLGFLTSAASARGAGSELPGISPDVLQLDLADLTVTDNVLEFHAVPSRPGLIPPSSKHLAQRRHDGTVRRQSAPTAPMQQELFTFAGEQYLTNVTIAGQTFRIVVDTGSSDT